MGPYDPGEGIMKKTLGFLAVLLLFVSWGCNSAGSVDFSGRFYVAMGPNPRGILDITQSDTVITFTLDGAGFSVEGSGTVSDSTLTLSASFAQFGPFESTLTSPDDGESFSGLWTISGEIFMEGTLAGTRTPWETYDVEALGIPLFVSADCIELSRMKRILKPSIVSAS